MVAEWLEQGYFHQGSAAWGLDLNPNSVVLQALYPIMRNHTFGIKGTLHVFYLTYGDNVISSLPIDARQLVKHPDAESYNVFEAFVMTTSSPEKGLPITHFSCLRS